MTKKKILVVDDEELLTKTFCVLLEKKLGHEIFIAKRGQDALDMAEEEEFDLVICDIRMPGIDGIETVKKLREIFSRRKTKCPPEVIITGFVDQKKEKEVSDLQPAAFVFKPFENMELIKRINMLLGE